MGRRGGIGGRRGHGISHGSRTHHHHGTGGGQAAFDTQLKEEWTDTWKNSMCNFWSRPVITAEACCCYYCALGKIRNVLADREWKEEDSCCNQNCCMACYANIFYCLGNAFIGGPSRCGVMARYQIGSETGCCQTCLIAYFCPLCNANQMLLELTDRGEFPGGIVCAKRPGNCPERPPPPPLPAHMGIDMNQLSAISTEMGQIQTQVSHNQGGQWQPEQTQRYHELNAQLQQLTAQQMMFASNGTGVSMTTGANGSPMVVAGGTNTFNTAAGNNNNTMMFGTTNTSMMQPPPPPPPPPLPGQTYDQQQPPSGFATWENTAAPPPPPPPGSGGLAWMQPPPQNNGGWQ